MGKEFLTIILSLIFCTISCYLTHIIHPLIINNFTLGKIKASAFITILLVCILHLLTFFFSQKQISHLELLILGGSFIGMTDKNKFSFLMLTSACCIFFTLYEIFHTYFIGPKAPGGVLGFFAFTSLLIIVCLKKLRDILIGF